VAVVLVMPKLGLTMTEGTIARWLVDVGAEVREGQPICEVETDKITTEVESPGPGTLLRRVEADALVPVGDGIAVIGEPGDEMQGALHGDTGIAVEQPSPEPIVHELAAATAAPMTADADEQDASDRARVSPVARKRAAELGVDLATVRGTGPGGRIVLTDVENAASSGKN